MKEIKSKKAKQHLFENLKTVENSGTFMLSSILVAESIIIAEQEAEERHSKNMQGLRDRAVEAFKSACSCGKEAGIGGKCERFTDCARYKMFIQKLKL